MNLGGIVKSVNAGKIRTLEKFLLIYSFAGFAAFFALRPEKIDFFRFVGLLAEGFKDSFFFFQGIAVFLFFYFIYLYAKTALGELNSVNGKKGGQRIFFHPRTIFSKTGEFLVFSLFLSLGSSAFLLVLYAVMMGSGGRLSNELVMGWDKIFFGVYPFIWFHQAGNPIKPILDFLTPAIIYSFQIMSLFMGASIGFFFGRKKILTAMIVSFFTAMAIGIFFWYAFPVNSPNNYFLSQNPGIERYDPNQAAMIFQANMREAQAALPPISTFPSSHVMWGMELVYFWAVYKKKTLWLSVPWFLFMALGTVYLAQHYAVDVVLAVPLGIVSIIVGQFLAAGTEEKEIT